MATRDPQTVFRRMLVLSIAAGYGFNAVYNGSNDRRGALFELRRLELTGDLGPDERDLLLGDAEPTRVQLNDATWRAEALYTLRWAVASVPELPIAQLSLMQALPDLSDHARVRARLESVQLRPEPELRRELERWFALYWRMRARLTGVERFDLAAWITGNPYLTVLTPDDLPLLDGDLAFDSSLMWSAAHELGVAGIELEGLVPIGACTGPMLSAADNVLQVTVERLCALRWLFGVTHDLDRSLPGRYEPLSTATADKAALYGDDNYLWRGGQPAHRAAYRGEEPGDHAIELDIDGDHLIHCAVHGGRRPTVARLLAEDPTAAARTDDEGRRALHLAAARDDVTMIDLLAPAGLDAVDSRGRTALVEAVHRGATAAAIHLVRLGASVDGALQAALEHDRPDLVRALAAHGVPVDEPDGQDQPPIYRALYLDRFDCALALLDCGADPRFTHPNGASLLHVAADQGAAAVAAALLDLGADRDQRMHGYGAVHFAMMSGHTAAFHTLVERGADVTGAPDPLLAMALEGGAAPIVRWCLEREPAGAGSDVTLHDCAVRGRDEVLRLLLAAGAPGDAVNSAGFVPLHLAADRGHAGCVEALLSSGVAVDAAAPESGFTPLHLAAMQGYPECVRLLVAAGAPVDVADAEGRTPLDWARNNHFTACVDALPAPS